MYHALIGYNAKMTLAVPLRHLENKVEYQLKDKYNMTQLKICRQAAMTAIQCYLLPFFTTTNITEFIIGQIVRPYQGMLGFEKRIESMRYVPFSKTETTIKYLHFKIMLWKSSTKNGLKLYLKGYLRFTSNALITLSFHKMISSQML
ncbi:MAG: hypothetical protein IPK03_16640 [Bacteroidetes bacterium]|nr:hypothetical protein [Bacteroidota bacterium]